LDLKRSGTAKCSADCQSWNTSKCLIDGSDPEGLFIDKQTGLIWEKERGNLNKNIYFNDAVKYCSNLELGGYSNWRLPNIDELRTLVRGCSIIETGGACQAAEGKFFTDKEVYISCKNTCGKGGGSGTNGCYWDTLLGENCLSYWSISQASEKDDDNRASYWIVDFGNGAISTAYNSDLDSFTKVICVTSKP